MQVVAGDSMYLVEGTPDDSLSGPVGFLIVPLAKSSILSSDDLVGREDYFPPDLDWVRTGFLTAVKELFDDKTYTDGTTSTTITNPVITEISQSLTNVTPS